MDSESNDSAARRVLSSHILSASVVMIGVSTTLIGLVKVAKAHMGPSRADQYAGSPHCSFFSVRSHRTLPSAGRTILRSDKHATA